VNRFPVPVVLGQTAVGKTEAAVEAACALRGEIVSADAMQVYRQMNLATAKPTAEQRRRAPHHLVDILDISEPYSVARFRNLALDLILEIRRRGRLPLVVGGSALYIKALVDGLSAGPPPNPAFRKLLLEQEEKEGHGFCFRQLMEADPETARRLHRNDIKRIVRALEVIETTGRSISSQQADWARASESSLWEGPEEGGFERDGDGEVLMPEYAEHRPRPRGDYLLIGLRRNREDLYARIDRRVEKMFAAGLVEETRLLIREGARDHRVAWQALGYKEIEKYLSGECTLDEARDRLAAATRHFARRQMTWWRRDPRIRWLEIAPDEPAAAVGGRIRDLVLGREEPSVSEGDGGAASRGSGTARG